MMFKLIYLCLIVMSSCKVEINKVMNLKRVFCLFINFNLGMFIIN